MSDRIVELNGDSYAIVITNGEDDYGIKMVPGPECSFTGTEVVMTTIRALAAFIGGEGDLEEGDFPFD